MPVQHFICFNTFSFICRKIRLSTRHVTNAARLWETYVHEICHMATWSEPEEHGPCFRRVIRYINDLHPDLPQLDIVGRYKQQIFVTVCLNCGSHRQYAIRPNLHGKTCKSCTTGHLRTLVTDINP